VLNPVIPCYATILPGGSNNGSIQVVKFSRPVNVPGIKPIIYNLQNVVWAVGPDAPANSSALLNQHVIRGSLQINFFGITIISGTTSLYFHILPILLMVFIVM